MAYLSYSTRACAELVRFDDACGINEAMRQVETSKEGWYEAEVGRVPREIALIAPGPDVVKAEGYFERALAVARWQQAKSSE
jgi:hypothetical protein